MRPRRAVLIVDDHPLFREGVRAVLDRSKRYDIVGEAASGAEALRLALDLRPELVLLDLSLPDRNGVEVCRELLSVLPRAGVVALSVHAKVRQVVRTLKAGAKGFLTKDATAEQLLRALEVVSGQGVYLDSALSGNVLQQLVTGPETPLPTRTSAYDCLTEREQEITVMLAEGLSPKEISVKLHISPKTVENHRSNLMRKLDVHSAHELIRLALKMGLIDVERWGD